MLSSDIHRMENDGTTGAAHLIKTFFWRKTRLLWFAMLLTLLISGYIAKKSQSSALLQSFRHFPYNENPTIALNTTSFKCSLPSTDSIEGRKKFTYAYEGSRSPHASALFLNSSGFRKQIGYCFNRVVWDLMSTRCWSKKTLRVPFCSDDTFVHLSVIKREPLKFVI